MPRQASVAVENNFRNGLFTEATGLNFPESACTETFDCIFEFDGSVSRRPGFDFESDATFKSIDRTNKAISTYLWRNVSGDGNVTLAVAQIGDTIYFWETNQASFSLGAVASTVTLTAVAGAPAVDAVEAQFCDGNGFLFVTHPYCDPIRIAYNITTHTATPTTITIKIRDFEGVDDGNVTDFRSNTPLGNAQTKYNLLNQGWTQVNLTAWAAVAGRTFNPSDADVMWSFKNATNDFDFSNTSLARITAGNSPAPKGHYILTLSNQDRNAAAGTAGVPSTTTGFQRPSTCMFFMGRVFYSGINYPGFNSKIYFTQIIDVTQQNLAQYGNCYQTNDPTAEDLFDLLPSDGGVIQIPDAGTIYKMMTVPGGFVAFGANGVWFISGSTGTGFEANDYAIQKVANFETISPTSFVSIAGYPAWWTSEGIYTMNTDGSPQNTILPTIKSLTFSTIFKFYQDIPLSSKKYARGFYDFVNAIVYWLYRSTPTTDVSKTYEYDRVLVYNLRTGAFYPWTISDSPVRIHGILIADSNTGATSTSNVIDAAVNPIIDLAGDQVVAFTVQGATAEFAVKFLTSYPLPFPAVGHNFTFSEANDTSYVDWLLYDGTGVNYVSYFISGYRIRGQGIRKFQTNWIRIFTKLLNTASYYFQTQWNYSTSGLSGRWSDRQLVTHSDPSGVFNTVGRRLKVRGHGVVLQFKILSYDGQPFQIIGWSSYDTTNMLP